MSGLRYSYVTNGLTDHRLSEALRMLAGHGYSGVGITLDHHHLDPLSPTLTSDVAAVAAVLQDTGLANVIETGGRFVLDPLRKHEPNLLSTTGSQRRVALLKTAIDVAADLGSEAVSFWAGRKPAGIDTTTAQQRLISGLKELVAYAAERDVTLAFEPEPGMLVETIDQWQKLADELADPHFRLTLDIGHCLVAEASSIPDCIARAGSNLANVQIEDMKHGVHEHLDFGDGDVDFAIALRALVDARYNGLVSVELSRHSHTAHTAVPNAIEFLHKIEAAIQ